ncbi:hypothetical protein ACHAXT_009154 [Thalassiosira profunda]
MRSTSNASGGAPSLEIDLKAVDPHKLDLLEDRFGGDGGIESGFTPPRSVVTPSMSGPAATEGRPRSDSGTLSNLTEVGGNSPLPGSVSFEQQDGSNAASNASCQTVHRANGKAKVGNGDSAPKKGQAGGSASSSHGSKKKSTPLKRPVSAIGGHATPTNSKAKKGEASNNGVQKKSKAKPKAGEKGGPKKSAAEHTTITKSEASRDAASTASGKTHSSAPENSRSESRDTLYSYFGTNASSSNHGGGTTSSNPSRSQLSSPPALQSKSTSHKDKGNQRTLHSFLGISDKKSEKDASVGEEEAKKGDDKEGVAGGDAVAAAAPSGAASKPAKKKKSSHKASAAIAGGNSAAHSEHSLQEMKRLHSQISHLKTQLEEANARNNSIKNNQTLISANLQRQLKHQKNEMNELRRDSDARMGRAAEAMERLVRDEAVKEAKETRQKLASDGARLGRLVSSRVGGMGRSHIVESWEDGHAPRTLKTRRMELKVKRESLEKRRDELARAGQTGGGSDPAVNEVHESSNAHDATLATMGDFELLEANETVRMHLDEIRREEKELDVEERALNIEKRSHVRALKLVANEDSSKFRRRSKLHERYVLTNLLGKGGFSEVWRAFDTVDFRHVAVKIHQLESNWSDAKKENYTKHVSREFEIHREVRHPRVVSLYDVFEIDTDSFATVLECCKGTDLDTMLKDRGRLPERDARAILIQVLSGMRYLSTPSADGRRQGIIHYDLKPGNILFDENGNAKITDFGLSKIVDAAEEGDSMELTSQGAGTYWYLPPECFLMDQDVRISNKVDVWSLGVIYFQMVYGRRPFGDGQSQDHILRNHTMLNATEVHFPPKPAISEEGKEFIQDCLTYDQMSRPNMSQLCDHDYLKLTSL